MNDIIFKKNIFGYFNRLKFKYQQPVKIRSFKYEKTNDYYLYSTVIVQNKRTIMIQPIIRISDYNSSNPFNLNKFSMVSVRLNIKNMKKIINITMRFLQNICKIDITKLGCVSISENNSYGYQGIESFIPQLKSWGISENNILIRDADEAVAQGSGDGFWRDPDPDFSNYQYWTITLYYQLANNSNISDYTDYTKWVEIGEMLEQSSVMGYERLKYVIQNKNKDKSILNQNLYERNN